MSAIRREFECLRCGACCRATGEVWLETGEPQTIADELGISEIEFIDHYTKLTHDHRGLTLIERPDGACIFLMPDNTCRIHNAKPRQCRDYPSRWRSRRLDSQCAGRRAQEAGK